MLVEDSFIEAFFKAPTPTKHNDTRAHGKRKGSSHPTKAINEAQANKREITHEEKAKKASVLNE